MNSLTVISSAFSERLQRLRVKLERDQFAPLARAPRKSIQYNPEMIDDKGRPMYGGGCRFIENLSDGLRVNPAEAYARGYQREGFSWYVDEFCGETTTSHVVQLPARGGKARYLAATSDPWNPDAYIVDFSVIHDTPEEAANAAQSLAECYSSDCREDDARFQVEMRAENLEEDIRDYRERHSLKIAAIRSEAATAPQLAEGVRESCRAIRARAKEAISELRQVRQDLA